MSLIIALNSLKTSSAQRKTIKMFDNKMCEKLNNLNNT